ncbi:ADP-glyceromanno-heptose 6-epimerase [Agrobacterium vitis]|uniref:ADP-L-glycero-D-manno-heptose-6-epimerase n=1 Tax=Agrobacterium vitis TaxID=373 RepID=A0A368P0F6_AGRVI|nr:ADP-glyceromanno-heptose 6-epimerase [Agrobacterium vitis]KAA3507548.1 ADP-glyceromanno-heptose 6-epimerase [Agrobacterium vitis]KAA3521888.1 ADP-glyceromanno-heptose 6-epimerase [Agrobacterium vitis]MCF1479969.1 ADP-glyceromanno-heptose 6-epimerase [Agrobacterium vitis]MUZ98438.1 ADP-glyceromanno-heptose 6-epimerase [Agrobacterium vitis]MVA31133.1 ADP-glyceromanno-heptose 6-epimerase [Agrobacterium vitis]
MYVVTGGAGFIGSNIAAALDQRGDDIVIIDHFGSDDFKWRNIAKRRIKSIVNPKEGSAFIERNAQLISGIFHMGAISATTETDIDLIVENNINFSQELWNICSEHQIPFVYASSAATYGDGSLGFVDNEEDAYLSSLRPLNAYGWSKHLFDRMVQGAIARKEKVPPVWAGLKFFNVYGPNEYHKGPQRSVAVQLYEQIVREGSAKLFRSDHPDYADGGQLRDFVWVGDCVDVALWLMSGQSKSSGIYNVGSGSARSFREKAEIIFSTLGKPIHIDYVDLPPKLKGKYQYFTEASLEKLRAAGYEKPLTTLEVGMKRYVENFLGQPDVFM